MFTDRRILCATETAEFFPSPSSAARCRIAPRAALCRTLIAPSRARNSPPPISRTGQSLRAAPHAPRHTSGPAHPPRPPLPLRSHAGAPAAHFPLPPATPTSRRFSACRRHGHNSENSRAHHARICRRSLPIRRAWCARSIPEGANIPRRRFGHAPRDFRLHRRAPVRLRHPQSSRRTPAPENRSSRACTFPDGWKQTCAAFPSNRFHPELRGPIVFSSAQKSPPAGLLPRKRSAVRKKNPRRNSPFPLHAESLRKMSARQRKLKGGGVSPARSRDPLSSVLDLGPCVPRRTEENTFRFRDHRQKTISRRRTLRPLREDRARRAQILGSSPACRHAGVAPLSACLRFPMCTA